MHLSNRSEHALGWAVSQTQRRAAVPQWPTHRISVDETLVAFDPIPTVSEWGLVVLTLLLLTGAKIYFGRRRAAD